jgi:hypothetical protein
MLHQILFTPDNCFIKPHQPPHPCKTLSFQAPRKTQPDAQKTASSIKINLLHRKEQTVVEKQQFSPPERD